MSALLLVIIYIIFVSLGLPDSFMGTCWPSIQVSLGVPQSFQGICSIIVCCFTIVAAFLSTHLQRKFTTFQIVSVSICLTVIGIFGVFLSPNMVVMIISLIPLGLGGGAIDSVLNNYVAVNYKAKQLHFLHGCWSLGAIISPIVSSFFLVNPEGWRNALLILAITQSVILLITFFSRPLWKKEKNLVREEKEEIKLTFFDTFKIRGAIFIILAFFFMVGCESLLFSWLTSMMVYSKGISDDVAANYTIYIYLGYTISRIISGLISNRISDKNIIRIFGGIFLLGILMLMFNPWLNLTPIVTLILGFGLGPIYPAIIHDTPNKFTEKLSASVMGVQIGCAYISMISISPLFGLIGENFGFDLLPFALLICFILMIVFSEISNILTKNKELLFKQIAK